MTVAGTAAVLLWSAGTAEAALVEVFCPPTLNEFPEQTRQYSLSTDPASTCYAYGSGNLGGAQDAFLEADPNSGWVFEGQNDAFDSTGSLTGGTSGDWEIDPAIFDPTKQYAVGVKDGGNPKWAVFLIPQGVSEGLWGVTSPQGGLSHLALYSRDGEPIEPGEEPIVPEPATVALLGLGLVAGGARLRRAMSRA
jgi:hypothetical protein